MEEQDITEQEIEQDTGSPIDTTVLDAVKRQALEALKPLIDDLKDMDPERKFDICMSAMRYTDDKALADSALKAALAIQENGTKAEALVELINEINYLEQA